MPPGDIHHPRSGLETLSHNPRFQVVRPPPVPAPRFHNLDPTNKSIPTVRHRNLRLITKTFWQTPQAAETGEINGSGTPHTVILPGATVFEEFQPFDDLRTPDCAAYRLSG